MACACFTATSPGRGSPRNVDARASHARSRTAAPVAAKMTSSNPSPMNKAADPVPKRRLTRSAKSTDCACDRNPRAVRAAPCCIMVGMSRDTFLVLLGGALAVTGGILGQLIGYALEQRTTRQKERRDVAGAVGTAIASTDLALARAFSLRGKPGNDLLREAAGKCRTVSASERNSPGTARLRGAMSRLAGPMEEIYLHPALFGTSPPESEEEWDEAIRECFARSSDVERAIARFVGRWH